MEDLILEVDSTIISICKEIKNDGFIGSDEKNEKISALADLLYARASLSKANSLETRVGCLKRK